MTVQQSLYDFGEPEFRALEGGRQKSSTVGRWPDGFALALPIDPIVLEDPYFRPRLVRLFNEQREGLREAARFGA